MLNTGIENRDKSQLSHCVVFYIFGTLGYMSKQWGREYNIDGIILLTFIMSGFCYDVKNEIKFI